MNLSLILKDVKDTIIRENFQRLQTVLLANTLLGPDFTFFEVDVPEPSLLYPVAHGLNFTPTDLLMLSVEGDFNFYFRFDKFDENNIYVATHGKCRLRFLLGRFPNKGKRGIKDSALSFVAPNLSTSSISSSLGGSGSDGWAFIQDSQYTQSSPLYIAANTNTLVPNNAAGSLTNYANAPANSSSWWDTVNYRFWPSYYGEFYTFRLNIMIVPTAANAVVTISYDIKTSNAPYQETIILALGAGIPQRISRPMPAPITQGAFSNGIGFYISASCPINISGINLTVIRDFHK